MAKPRRKELIDKDMRKLIQMVTGFDRSDENFHLCVSFAESNFKYHRYLSPDSHKIMRSMEGLCEKFQVHSQGQKATDLRELADKFLEQPGLDGKDTGKTDVHYAMLSLLLELTESPTKTEFQRMVPEVVQEEVDDFDWAGYLLDPEDLNFMSFASSDSEEEDDLEDSDSGDTGSGNEDMKSKTTDLATERLSPSTTQGTVSERTSTRIPSSMDISSLYGSEKCDEFAELSRSLVVEYWAGAEGREEATGSHAASNLHKDWQCFQARLQAFPTLPVQTMVTELQVVRETIWMLSGITDLFIFIYKGEFSLNPNVCVSHLTTESLENSLRPLMRKAMQVSRLQELVQKTVSQGSIMATPESTHHIPQTYQAFATSVSEFLSDFRGFLVKTEKSVMKQENLVTLAKLTSDLQPWLAKIDAVHDVYISGIGSSYVLNTDMDTGNNCLKASLLLDVLYQAVFESDLMSLTDGDGKSNLMLKMLVKSSKPLIQITSNWINKGQLYDPADEFVVQRNKEVKTLDETFWEKAFVSSVRDSDSTRLSEKGNTVSKKTNQPCNSTHFCVKHGPKFLQPILGEAILTGKSMEMLENLGRLGEVLDIGCGIYQQPSSLFELFARDLKSKLGIISSSSEKRNLSSVEAIPSHNQSDGNIDLIDKHLNMRGQKDTLLNINFQGFFQDPETDNKNQAEDEVDDILIGGCDLSPVMKLCESCLYPHVRSRSQTVCFKLVLILKKEYNLMDCIHAMQRYYLMSSGELMYDFYTPVFNKIQNRDYWRDFSMLEMYLHEAVSPKYPKDVARLSVSLNPASTSPDTKPINSTDSIHLKYNVPWPLDVVISEWCQERYNRIFTFLLQVKRAKHALDQLRFEELSRLQAIPKVPLPGSGEDINFEEDYMPRETRVHRFHLLRFRLLYFVNSLHNYIMTRILHSTGLEFESRLEAATDLEQIISTHKEYVDAIYERCLLHPKLAFLKEAVIRVLNISLTYGMHWRQGIDFISGESIEEMELELSRCVHFLSSFLNNVVKRGSFPHLESLAFALMSSLQHGQKT